MGLFSRFERGMENGIEGAADKVFDAPISPVQISKKAEKAMKREKMVGSGRQYAPTLYTVLVNPDDDRRLFGYYPTLAGETETYLAAKADEEGLAMDGQPLVRFIVDEELKHGKFDVIAEMVSAPIIAQLRQEEMERYGLAGGNQGHPQQSGGQGRQAGTPQAAQQNFRRGQGNYSGYDGEPAGYAQRQPGAGYGNGQPAYGGQQGASPAYGAPYQANAAAQSQGAAYAGAYQGGNAQPQGRGAAAAQQGAGQQPYAGQAPYAGQPQNVQRAAAPAQAKPAQKQPLPYVPEDEIDRSIDYGEYTFNSQDFDSYENDRAQSQQAARQGGAASAYGRAPQAAGSAAQSQQVQAGWQQGAQSPYAGASGASQSPRVIPAQLVDARTGRSYQLVSNRMILGRSSASDLVVDDINASRSHAELRFESQGVWVITDLGSTNGTYVNGQRITTRALSEGDRISVGMTELVFTLS